MEYFTEEKTFHKPSEVATIQYKAEFVRLCSILQDRSVRYYSQCDRAPPLLVDASDTRCVATVHTHENNR